MPVEAKNPLLYGLRPLEIPEGTSTCRQGNGADRLKNTVVGIDGAGLCGLSFPYR